MVVKGGSIVLRCDLIEGPPDICLLVWCTCSWLVRLLFATMCYSMWHVCACACVRMVCGSLPYSTVFGMFVGNE